MEYDQRQEFRINKTLKKFFLDLGDQNTSEYIRNLIYNDLAQKGNPDFIKEQIQQKKQEIKQLEEKLNSPHIMMDQVTRFFEEQAPGYKKNAPFRTIGQRHRFIKDNILPKVKKFGFNKSVEEIDQLLINFPDKNLGNNGGE